MLVEGRSQLVVVYHLMFRPELDKVCKGLLVLGRQHQRIDIPLAHRDIAFLAISRAPLARLGAYRKRMGWSFKWVSSGDSDFNSHLGVSFDPEAARTGAAYDSHDTGVSVGERCPG